MRVMFVCEDKETFAECARVASARGFVPVEPWEPADAVFAVGCGLDLYEKAMDYGKKMGLSFVYVRSPRYLEPFLSYLKAERGVAG